VRYLPALAGALFITVAVFLFMRGLIRAPQPDETLALVHENVEIFRTEQPEPEPEPEQEAPEEPTEQPVMEALEVKPPTPEPATDLDLPPLDLSVGEISVKAGGDRWSAPLGRGVVGVQAGGGGEDAQGYIEVIPYDTRRPNVPEVAWQNKINGWVLVAFRVTAQGTTRDVRVLDANPRGVFEDAVVSAVRDWRYRVNFYGSASRSVVLTQKVEVRWENFPANLPNVD